MVTICSSAKLYIQWSWSDQNLTTITVQYDFDKQWLSGQLVTWLLDHLLIFFHDSINTVNLISGWVVSYCAAVLYNAVVTVHYKWYWNEVKVHLT